MSRIVAAGVPFSAARICALNHCCDSFGATLRSAVAQEQVLGIRLFDLQLALCNAWHLPDLVKMLMDDANAEKARVRNVILAVNLARHSANDWNDPALPDDFAAIEKLLHIDRNTLLGKLAIPDDVARQYRLPPPGSECE